MGPDRKSDRIIPTLDGWRAVAVLAVVVSHGITHVSPLRWLRLFGPHGVFIFFGISGFLIAGKLLEEEERRGRPDLRGFYVRRAFRILPASMLFLGVVASLGWAGILQATSLKQSASCALFFQNYLGEFPGRVPYTGHFWSLAVEEHFYLLLPGMLFVLGATRLRKWVVALCGAAVVWRWFDDRTGVGLRFFPGAHPAYRTDRCLDFLLWGVLLALMFRQAAVRERLRTLLTTPVWCVLAVAWLWDIYFEPPLVSETVEAVLIALLLAGTVLRPETAQGSLLQHPILTFIGRISYSIYLWQQLFFVAAFRRPELLQQFPINAVCTLLCATASYYCVELPLIALGRRVLKGAPANRPSNELARAA